MELTNNLPIPENSTTPVNITTTTFFQSVQRLDTKDTKRILSFVAALGDEFSNTSNENVLNDGLLEYGKRPDVNTTGSIEIPISAVEDFVNPRVTFSIYVRDTLFLRRNNNSKAVASVIVGSSVVGEKITNLDEPVTLRFKMKPVSCSCLCWSVIFVFLELYVYRNFLPTELCSVFSGINNLTVS